MPDPATPPDAIDQARRRQPPRVARVSYAEHAREAARREHPHDPDTAGAVAAEATRLEPLQAIQTAFDQMYARLRDRLAGVPWDHSGGGYREHARDVLAHARRRASVLVVAADAAMAMVGRMQSQVTEIEDHMSDDQQDRPNPITPSGAPHPLQAGGYDAAADPQLPGNESDVAALKAGHTTRAQAEAIARGDAAAAEEKRRAEEEAASRAKAKQPILQPAGKSPPPDQPQQPRPNPPPPRQPAPGPPKK